MLVNAKQMLFKKLSKKSPAGIFACRDSLFMDVKFYFCYQGVAGAEGVAMLGAVACVLQVPFVLLST